VSTTRLLGARYQLPSLTSCSPPTPPFTPPVSCYQWTTKIGSAIGGAFLAAAIITGSIDNPDIFDLSRYWHLWLIAASYQPMGTSFPVSSASDQRTCAPLGSKQEYNPMLL
jgi:hypothetical protein